MFEVLHRPLVLLRSLAALERPEVPPLAGFRVLFPRVKPVLACFQFAYHAEENCNGYAEVYGSSFVMPPGDVTAAAYELQTSIFRDQTSAQKFRAAVDMSEFTHRLALAGVRERHPGCGDEEAARILVDELYPERRRSR